MIKTPKLNTRRLKLDRDTLRTLTATELSGAAGGISQDCTLTTMFLKSVCVCPEP